ncbi:predicted protein [Streptomyces viridosporus ATCC 14672]|uniref:Predicted protein n=1 Tax=Streptomyces viridosporus (strain ATCC 14672 / DSM 40746 / JCM 4963 / KCTC 9882 / NRRL B-12104 / FH 1290) TaxID=566461 RepID=D5ZUA4_STRV1|nr:predicted protein [Streptomyces viridosporus ATCC 14672]
MHKATELQRPQGSPTEGLAQEMLKFGSRHSQQQ